MTLQTNDYISPHNIPSKKVEAWKYSNIKPWLENKTYEQTQVDLLQILKEKLPSATISIRQDISSLAELFNFSYQDTVKNFALSGPSQIYEIIIPKKEKLELELKLSLSLEASFQNTLFYFVLEDNAQLDYLLDIKASSQSLHLIHHYFHLKPNSHLHYGRVQDQDKTSASLGYDQARVEKDASFESCALHLGSLFSRYNVDIALMGEGAYGSANGVYPLTDKQHCDTYSHIHHFAPHTLSGQLYKGILNDESHGIFTGRIHVHKDAQQINSEQLNKTLLLSPKAHSHSRPQLEIFADDVKCSHGSTTGQLNPDEIFYLQSRGIDPRKGAKILAHGFAYDVTHKLKSPWLKTKLTPYLKATLS